MVTHHVQIDLRFFFVGLISLASSIANAGLSGPPASHMRPLPDGKHMLVFLSYVPEAEDEGKIATLPNGQEVSLRETFPASGCYEIGSTTPLWTAPWDGKEYWIVSDDGRYLIRWNLFGDGDFRLLAGGGLSWALKFHDRARELRSYDVAELLDYPSLMKFTSSDYHYLWFDDEFDENFTIRDSRLYVWTSTHEHYVFDVATGEIVEEYRMWRTITRITYTMAFACVVGMGWLVRRRFYSTGRVAAQPLKPHAPSAVETMPAPTRRFSFGMRTLFALTSAVGLLCWIGYRWPHVALFACAVVSAVVLTRMSIRSTRRSGKRRSRVLRLGVNIAATWLVWCFVYFLSIGPVFGLLHRIDAPNDVKMAVVMTVYRPYVWMEYYAPFDADRPLESYFRAWGMWGIQ